MQILKNLKARMKLADKDFFIQFSVFIYTNMNITYWKIKFIRSEPNYVNLQIITL